MMKNAPADGCASITGPTMPIDQPFNVIIAETEAMPDNDLSTYFAFKFLAPLKYKTK